MLLDICVKNTIPVSQKLLEEDERGISDPKAKWKKCGSLNLFGAKSTNLAYHMAKQKASKKGEHRYERRSVTTATVFILFCPLQIDIDPNRLGDDFFTI